MFALAPFHTCNYCLIAYCLFASQVLYPYNKNLLSFFLHALVWCYCPNWHCADRRDDTLHFREFCRNSVLEQFIDVYDGMGLPALIIVNKNV
jgi:hypothetical protein